MRRMFSVLIMCMFAIAGCAKYSPDGLLPSEATKASNQLVDAFLEKDMETILALSSEDFLKVKGIKESLVSILEYIPDENAGKPTLVFTQIRKSEGEGDSYPIYLSQYEIAHNSEFILLNLYVNDKTECCKLQHIEVNSYKTSPSTINNFTFKDKTLRHYVFLAGLVLIPIFIIFTLVSCVRNKQLKRKWLWFLFILVGVFGFSLNWTTGEIGNEFFSRTENGSLHISLFSFHILGAGIIKSSVFGAWKITLAFPLGAILYWMRRKIRARKDAEVF